MDGEHDPGMRSGAFRTVSFFVLILGGQVLLLPVLLTFLLAKSVTRQPSLVYFCLAWVIFSIFGSLLLYSGQLNEPDPPRAVCLVQLAGMLGSYILAGSAAICLAIQVYWATPNGGELRRMQRFEHVLSFIPPLAWAIHQLVFLIIHLVRSDGIQVARRDQLCVIEQPHGLTRASQGIAAVCAGLSICVTVVMVIRAVGYLRAQGMTLRRLARGSRRAGSASVWIRILIRLTVFELYCVIVVLVVVIMAAGRPASVVRQAIDFIIFTIPFVTFLVFGTSRDILSAWGLRAADPLTSTMTGSATGTGSATRKGENYAMSPLSDAEDPYSPLPRPRLARARRMESHETLRWTPDPAEDGQQTPSLYHTQTQRDPKLSRMPTLPFTHDERGANVLSLYATQAERDPALDPWTPSPSIYATQAQRDPALSMYEQRDAVHSVFETQMQRDPMLSAGPWTPSPYATQGHSPWSLDIDEAEGALELRRASFATIDPFTPAPSPPRSPPPPPLPPKPQRALTK